MKRNQFSLFQSPLDLAHGYWEKIVKRGDKVIDATCGNGHDALILAKLVGSKGHLVAFDIQKQAIQTSRTYLSENIPIEDMPQVDFILGCHSHFPETISKESVRLVVYNLGYLPRTDKSVITKTETTLKSLEKAMELLMPGGVISITCYPGHEGGDKEEIAILELVKNLSQEKWSSCYHQWINRKKSPSLILLQKSG